MTLIYESNSALFAMTKEQWTTVLRAIASGRRIDALNLDQYGTYLGPRHYHVTQELDVTVAKLYQSEVCDLLSYYETSGADAGRRSILVQNGSVVFRMTVNQWADILHTIITGIDANPRFVSFGAEVLGAIHYESVETITINEAKELLGNPYDRAGI